MSRFDDIQNTFFEHDGAFYVWKTPAAVTLGVNTKTLERHATAGRLRAIEINRKTYYHLDDLKALETRSAAAVVKPSVVDTSRQTPTNEALAAPESAAAPQIAQALGTLFSQINEKLDNIAQQSSAGAAGARLERITGKLFLTIDDAATAAGLSRTMLEKTIRERVRAGELSKFRGAKGRAVYRAADLEEIINHIAPDDSARRAPIRPTK